MNRQGKIGTVTYFLAVTNYGEVHRGKIGVCPYFPNLACYLIAYYPLIYSFIAAHKEKY